MFEGITTSTFEAGDTRKISLTLRDDSNNTITTDFPDADRLTAYSTGEVSINGVTTSVAFDQTVNTNDNNEFFVNAKVNSVGTFELHVKEGTTGALNSFSNSPITITIYPADTEPSKTNVEEEDDGDDRKFTLETFDVFGNPTTSGVHNNDKLEYVCKRSERAVRTPAGATTLHFRIARFAKFWRRVV